MKKLLGILLCLVVVGGGVFYYLKTHRTGDQLHYAGYLPQDTVVTVSLTHLNRLADTFPGSPLGKFLSKETMTRLMKELGADANELQEYMEFHDRVAGVMTNPAFRAVFGDDAIVALLSPDLGRLQENPEEELKRSMVIFATTGVSGALDTFAKLVMSEEVSSEMVGELELTKVNLEEEVVYGYAENGTVLLAYDPESIASCVAVSRSEEKLINMEAFSAAKAFWQPIPSEMIYSRVFVNVPVVQTLMDESGEKEAGYISRYMQGVSYGASVVYEEEDALQVRSRAGYIYEQLDEVTKGLIESLSEKNTSLNLLGGNSLVYQWASSLNGDMIRATLEATDAEGLQRAQAMVKEELGVTLDELLQAIGPQYGGVVNEIVNAGFFPVPKVILFLEVRDAQLAEQILMTLRDKAAQAGIAEEQSLEVDGSTIYYWPVLPGEATQPAVVLTQGMLYLANGKGSLEKLIKDKQERSRLAGPVVTKLGEELSNQLATSNYESFVMFPARLADEVGGVLEWLGGLIAASRGTSMQTLSEELLTLMRSTEAVVVTSQVTKEQAESMLTLKLTPKEQP